MSWRLVEFDCPRHGRFEELLPRSESAASSHRCPFCPAVCERVLSAPKVGTVWGCAAQRGGNEPPHENPAVLNTRKLAEGQSYSDWKAERKKFRMAESIAESRKRFGV